MSLHLEEEHDVLWKQKADSHETSADSSTSFIFGQELEDHQAGTCSRLALSMQTVS
jgi:hypothetical protein